MSKINTVQGQLILVSDNFRLTTCCLLAYATKLAILYRMIRPRQERCIKGNGKEIQLVTKPDRKIGRSRYGSTGESGRG